MYIPIHSNPNLWNLIVKLHIKMTVNATSKHIWPHCGCVHHRSHNCKLSKVHIFWEGHKIWWNREKNVVKMELCAVSIYLSFTCHSTFRWNSTRTTFTKILRLSRHILKIRVHCIACTFCRHFWLKHIPSFKTMSWQLLNLQIMPWSNNLYFSFL